MQSTSGNAGLDEAQVGIKIAGRNINNLTYVDDISITAQSEEFKSLLMKVKEESEMAVLKLNTGKKRRTRHQVQSLHGKQTGKQWEQWQTFIFLGSNVDGDCSHEIKRLLGRKAMTNLDSILKNREITLLTKVCLVKPMVFPIVM